jgi:ankyrin repeat protein
MHRKTSAIQFIVLPAVFVLFFCSSSLTAQSRFDADDGITTLMRAARDGDDKAFNKALRRRPNVDVQDVYGWTALTYAVVRDEEEMAESLLAAGADANIVDEDARSILMHAIDYHRESIVKLLIAHNADVHCRDKSGATAMGLAWTRAYDGIVELLKAAGAAELSLEEKRADIYSGIPSFNGPFVLQDAMMPAKWLPSLGYGRYRMKMRVLVGADGAVQKIRVLIGLPNGYTDKIVESEYKSRYQPAIKNGQTIAAWTTREFTIESPGRSR